MEIKYINHIYKYYKTIINTYTVSCYELIKIKFLYLIKKRKLKSNTENKKIFFILSMGRSGTQFLSTLFNKQPNALVYHEPCKRDLIEFNNSYNDKYNPDFYIANFRKQFIYYAIYNNNITTYGEVNSYLRRHASSIVKTFPNAKTLFLIRNGKDFVRSSMSRPFFDYGFKYGDLMPNSTDPFYSEWPKWGAFEKLCWLWASDNKVLYNIFGKPILFEKIITDYNYFKKYIINHIELEITKSIWEKSKNQKSKNQTITHKFPEYKEWSEKEKNIFWEICGEMMSLAGYENRKNNSKDN